MLEELTHNFTEVKFKEKDDFLKISETLTRLGLYDNESKTLTQICFILHKKQKYYIVHFKEMLQLDGHNIELTEQDVKRRNKITKLLNDWNLLTIACEEKFNTTDIEKTSIKVIKFSEKDKVNLKSKYNFKKRLK